MKSVHVDIRALAAALHHGFALALACVAVIAPVEAEGLGATQWEDLPVIFAIAAPIQITVNLLFGVYQGIWRYTSLPDIQRIVFSVVAGAVCISIALRLAGLDAHLD